ncbi:hypothetical protein ACHAXT_000415 [Thalassiosira profunda]
MPPATAMDPANDPFSQFGQLNLNAQPAAPSPATPPQEPKQATQTGYQLQPAQQPMQVSPDHGSAMVSVQQPGQPQMYANYQHNATYGQPMPQMQQPTASPQAMQQALTSPPISPLWNATSPGQTPPEAANALQPAANGVMPAIPNGFAAPAPVGMPVPTLSPASPSEPVAVAAANPFDMFAPSQPAPAAAPPVPPAPVDPFASSMAPAPAVPAPAPQAQAQPQQDDDFWGSMGFDQPNQDASAGNVTPGSSVSSVTSGSPFHDETVVDNTPVTLDERGLPAGGEYYKARVTTPMLGAIFSSGREVRSTLFKGASDSFVEAIGDRPVISFTIDGSAAWTAGIELGHVLLKVNDQEVSQTDEAVKTVGAASRPMTLEFYVPSQNVKVVKTEGQCNVKYDNHSLEAPPSACEWKPKYVVVGDMLGKPHVVYMYRSKKEYDTAVKESQTRNRALSVKVKQFDIRGARLAYENGTVKYPNKARWHYFTIMRSSGLPIKISAPTAEALKPVHDGIAAFLEKEERTRRDRLKVRMDNGGVLRDTYY